ncbi:interleukin-1 receptor type 1 isoform X2 [Balearica regulorum gibbericeps]|uniref:interleukin-1 receptor type 1 isoform X2 n=1 Tax=Balearica regulorum gibbericeps TaxID=100784 RepID=UPI003F5EB9A0
MKTYGQNPNIICSAADWVYLILTLSDEILGFYYTGPWKYQGNITAKTLFLCNITTAFLSLIIAEKCDAYDVMLRQSLVPDGQPLAIKCSLEKSLKSEDYNLTWYKVGNQTAVPRDKLSRIHQQKNLIWFLPAMLEDSGDYECVIRNLTSCRKMCTKVTVFERIDGLCLNKKFAVEEVIFTLSSAKVVCPHLDYFRNEKNIQPVRWYKDCQLLEGKRFAFSNSDLIIFNVTVHDQGNYTCETTYAYNGKQYNISRDVSLTVEVSPPKKPPEISYPRNNSIEVELDGKIYDACVLYTKSSRGRSFYRLETFVHRILPDVLEQQCGYNLFILGRDDSPGEAVVSVADETVKQSRRLMIILGSEASSCCLLEDTSEQQLAMYNALIRDGIQVILIEIDEIQDYTSMPESIKYIKQKHGAIQWKGDFSEKSCSANTRFWKYVRYQMPSGKKVSYSEVYLLPLTLNNSAAKGS